MPQALKLASVYSSHMVIQRGRPLPLRGQTTPRTQVTATLAGHSATTQSHPDGAFLLTLPPLPASGPHTLDLTSGDERLTLTDILIGDVWLCSGQSNMEWPVAQSNNADAELADAAVDSLRLLQVPRVMSDTPATDVAAQWQPASIDSAQGFSAVGFFFARQLTRELGVPIGVINSSWGGTAAEAWIPRDALASRPEHRPIVDRIGPTAETAATEPHADPGNTGFPAGLASDNPPGAWVPMDLPRTWQSAGINCNGAVWFRFDLDLSDTAANQPATLSLGIIDDFDTTYINGVEVGHTGMETNAWWMHRRVYEIPAGLLRPGKNTIAIRVFDQWGAGGICGRASDMSLTVAGAAHSVAGPWHYQVELPLPIRTPGAPPISPTALYNAMIHPLLPFPIRGALWYQGETNADRAHQYRTLLPDLIASWRSAWHIDFPFYIVQLANWKTRADYPGESDWAELRESQFLAQRALPDVHTISAIDVGDAEDIHPRDKQTVATRLARAALATSYGHALPWRHPTFSRASFHPDGAVTVELNDAKGLHLRGDHIEGFALCGPDKTWHWAHAAFTTEPSLSASPTLRVHSDQVPHPIALRYAWMDNPPSTLFNTQNLPLLPFRTDNFPLLSLGRA